MCVCEREATTTRLDNYKLTSELSEARKESESTQEKVNSRLRDVLARSCRPNAGPMAGKDAYLDVLEAALSSRCGSDERYAFYLLDARDLALVRCVDFQFYSSTVLQFYSSTVLQFYISTCLHCYISTLRFS